MKSLFNTIDTAAILKRIEQLPENASAKWGKMNSGQMLAHCSETMLVAKGDRKIPRLLIGYILGPLFKSDYVSEKAMRKNDPTHPSFIVNPKGTFDEEKKRLMDLVQRFSEGGEEKCTRNPHAFFGKMTPYQWGTTMHKHLDHHLTQFGV